MSTNPPPIPAPSLASQPLTRPAATRSQPLGEGHDEMLTKQELAAKLKVSVRCIENWQRAGYLPFIKVASVVLFYWPDVLAHLKTNFQVSPARPEGARKGSNS